MYGGGGRGGGGRGGPSPLINRGRVMVEWGYSEEEEAEEEEDALLLLSLNEIP